MTKIDFIKKACDRCELSQKDMATALDAIEDTLLEDVFAVEESVRLKIGTFSGFTRETSDRKGRNPKTGETIEIKGKTISGYPKVKWSKLSRE